MLPLSAEERYKNELDQRFHLYDNADYMRITDRKKVDKKAARIVEQNFRNRWEAGRREGFSKYKPYLT